MRIILLFVLLTIISCQQKENNTSTASNFEFYPNIDTSIYKLRFLEGVRKNNKIFNLPDLLDGTKDSLEIRIWPSESFDLSTNVLLFKYDGAEWTGYHYNSYTSDPGQDDSLMTYTGGKKIGDSVFLVKQIIPVCGWQRFSDSLAYFNIKTLPTQRLIKDFKEKLILDGYAVRVEIATTKSYRTLSYTNPFVYEYTECNLMEGFMEMLWRQLGNDYLWPREWLYPKKVK